eukprot:XP_800540.1 PREDICTED: uncharacterized protein LOC589083 [Strongylocentrotus purpuratus]
MGFRRRFIGFTGAVQILLTLAMLIMASLLSFTTLANVTNNAVGSPLWGGIIILMCGAGNIIDALESPSKKRSTQEYHMLPLNFGTLLANLIAFFVSATIIGLFSWSVSTVINALVVPSSAIILAASFICIFSFFALCADCCQFCFTPPPHQQRPYYVDYDGPPRGIPNQVFKA